jgi:hypothetical protein
LDILERDHEDLAKLFHAVSQPEADRAGVLQEMICRLAEHVSVERSVLYPVVKHGEIGGPELAEQLQHDYHEIEHLLVLIERRKVNSPDMPALVTDLIDVARAHATRADAVLCPALRDALAPDELVDLGARMSSAEKVILSHPHPDLLSLGPLSRASTRLAAIFDRLRDRTVNNRMGRRRK